MKGIIRMIEVVLASILLLGMSTFFFSAETTNEKWVPVDSQLQIRDALGALDTSGKMGELVDRNDAAGLNGNLSALLTNAIDFSVEISNIPPPVILIACGVCNDLSDIKSHLNATNELIDFKYKGRDISIRIENYPDINKINDKVSITGVYVNVEPDILFVTDERKLIDNKDAVEKFIERGGSVVLYGTLTETNNKFIKKIFDTETKNGGSKNGGFIEPNNLNNVSYKISEYFINLSDSTTDKNVNFDFSQSPELKVKKDTIVSTGSGGHAIVHANTKFTSNQLARSAIFPQFIINDEEDGGKTAHATSLFRSVIMWASGEKYLMDVRPKTRPDTYGRVSYISSGNHTSEPYKVDVTYWKVFY